jgi:murein L,D-transpeptidase YafK
MLPWLLIFYIYHIVLNPAKAYATYKINTSNNYVLILDKFSNTLNLAIYRDEGYKVVNSYHATLGQVQGDKLQTNDLKTPEGIYIFENARISAKLAPKAVQVASRNVFIFPILTYKLGIMAFSMNFPNPFDRLTGATGSGIMMHGTNEPERLKKKLDSEGCIVISNESMIELKPYIQFGITPILIFANLKNDSSYLVPNEQAQLRAFFNSWISAWATKNIDVYIDHYHSKFVSQGKNLAAWKSYKNRLNQQYESIDVSADAVSLYAHPKYYTIIFTQNYGSRLKNGNLGHKSVGKKIVYIALENNTMKIISEHYLGSL